MGTRTAALADQFEQAFDDLAKAVKDCSEGRWQEIVGPEKWTVAATAHHVAAQLSLEKEYLDAAAEGRTSPAYTWDDINTLNEKRAAENSAVGKDTVLRMIADGKASMGAYVRGLDDAQLDRTMALPLADGAEVSLQQLLEGGVLIDHARGHLKSILAAV
jgi:hypothetical protein